MPRLTIDSDGSWQPSGPGEATYRFRVETAPSGRAGCRKCSEKILKGSLRIGRPIKWREWITSWVHVSCFWLEASDAEDKEDDDDDGDVVATLADGSDASRSKKEGDGGVQQKHIYGLDQIKDADALDLLSSALQRTSAPAHLKAVDPNAPDFILKPPLTRVKTPAAMTVDLLPFQEEGFGWMLLQERGFAGGGILADQMGMGKTIQTIALLLADKEDPATVTEWLEHGLERNSGDEDDDEDEGSTSAVAGKVKAKAKAKSKGKCAPTTKKTTGKAKANAKAVVDDDDNDAPTKPKAGKTKVRAKTTKKAAANKNKKNNDDDEGGDHSCTTKHPYVPLSGPTLVVAPSSALLQWYDEIERCTVEGTLKVLVYHSATRKKLTPADIMQYDVVLTSYPILEHEHRTQVNMQKVKCVYCDRMFLPRKLAPHHKYFCGPEAVRTERLAKREVKRESATKKAMVTLNITQDTSDVAFPTPSNIYRDLMKEANREPVPMYKSAKQAMIDNDNAKAKARELSGSASAGGADAGASSSATVSDKDKNNKKNQTKKKTVTTKRKRRTVIVLDDDVDDSDETEDKAKVVSKKVVDMEDERKDVSDESLPPRRPLSKRASAAKASAALKQMVELDSSEGDDEANDNDKDVMEVDGMDEEEEGTTSQSTSVSTAKGKAIATRKRVNGKSNSNEGSDETDDGQQRLALWHDEANECVFWREANGKDNTIGWNSTLLVNQTMINSARSGSKGIQAKRARLASPASRRGRAESETGSKDEKKTNFLFTQVRSGVDYVVLRSNDVLSELSDALVVKLTNQGLSCKVEHTFDEGDEATNWVQWRQGRWVGAPYYLPKQRVKEGWVTVHESVGELVVRSFDRTNMLAVVVAYCPPSTSSTSSDDLLSSAEALISAKGPAKQEEEEEEDEGALWHVVHADGDEEDLDEQEIQHARGIVFSLAAASFVLRNEEKKRVEEESHDSDFEDDVVNAKDNNTDAHSLALGNALLSFVSETKPDNSSSTQKRSRAKVGARATATTNRTRKAVSVVNTPKMKVVKGKAKVVQAKGKAKANTKKTKNRARASFSTANNKIDLSQSDDEYRTESESESDDDDDDYVHSDDSSVKVTFVKASPGHKSKPQTQSEALVIQEEMLQPTFTPATWGIKDRPDFGMKIKKQVSGVKTKASSTKKNKDKSGKKSKSNGKTSKKKSKAASSSSSSSSSGKKAKVRKTSAAQKSPKKPSAGSSSSSNISKKSPSVSSTRPRRKAAVRERAIDESEDDSGNENSGSSASDEVSSSSSEEEEDDGRIWAQRLAKSAGGRKKPTGGATGGAVKVEFAPAGQVVDDDGIDLGHSMLHCIAWKRIILDEAHKIKDRVNSTAKSMFALRGHPKHEGAGCGSGGGACHRWCLTGTPLQNRVGELYSLIRFLRVDPYAYYFCKEPGCDCRKLNWTFGGAGRRCEDCGHTPMKHFSYFNKTIINPIKRTGYTGDGRKAMMLLQTDLLGKLMLRRTKAERADDINLPPLVVEVGKVKLAEDERDFYESVYKNTRSKFDTFVKKGTLMHNYAHIFELLSRLRQAVDHPYLVIHGRQSSTQDRSYDVSVTNSARRSDVCGICFFEITELKQVAVSHCRHTFHRDCIKEYMDRDTGADGIEDDDESGAPGDVSIDDLAKSATAKKAKGKGAEKAKAKGKGKKAAVAKRPRGGKAPDVSHTKSCPVCFVPLSVTIGVHASHQMDGEMDGAGAVDTGSGAADEDECVVCMDSARNALLMPCGHISMCYACATSLEKRACPVCRHPVTKIVKVDTADSSGGAKSSATADTITIGDSGDLSTTTTMPARVAPARLLVGKRSILQHIKMDDFASSAKVDAVVDAVLKMMQLTRQEEIETNGQATQHKAIVFSQYTNMLDILEWKLKTVNVPVVKLVGSMTLPARQAAMAAFKGHVQPEVPVILMSLKAGGEGLNLQEASHVFVLEPWWNPAVEQQAIQRAHRIGQKRSVHAVRFVVEDSIEEKMMELQEKKKLVFESTVDGSKAAMAQLTEQDLRFLFSRG